MAIPSPPHITTSAAGSSTTTATTRTVDREFRPELHGLRAVAVILVVIYHIWLGRVSGGVDVFLFLSGFLVTGQLVRAIDRGGIDYLAVWARILRRLMPATLTVLAACTAAGVLLLPQNRWLQTIREIAASALFMQNWQLAHASADYFAQHDTAGIVQHFWSLSIQGQFYLLWPILFGLIARATARHRRVTGKPSKNPVTPLRATLAAVFVASLAFSVWLTTMDQPLAYFHLLTRLWEFAYGGLLALMINKLVLPPATRLLLGWLGVVGLVSCGLVLQVGQEFPGFAALWPTSCAAAVLVAGSTGHPAGVDRVLASSPMRRLGDLSFSLYLWHWPVLIVFLARADRESPGVIEGLAVMVVSLCLAALTHRFVERPATRHARRPRVRRDLLFAAAGVVGLLAAVGCWQVISAQKARVYAHTVGDPDHPGALARQPGFEYWGADDPPLVPSLLTVGDEWAHSAGLTCEMSPRGAGLEVCQTRTRGAPARRFALVGDSHPAQFLAALGPIAEERDWQLIVMTRGACAFSTQSEIRRGDETCLDWNSVVLDELLAQRPDFVFTTASRNAGAGLSEYTPAGYIEQWRKLADENIPVLAVRDNPRFATAPSACVEARGRTAPECGSPRTEVYSQRPPYDDVPDIPVTVRFLDFSDSYCDGELCPAVIGNVLVYMDTNHLTATYVATMRPVVERALDAALADLQLGHPAS